MIIRALTDTGDWTYGKGKQDYLRDVEALKLNIQTRLLSWKGDCFFALAEGVDYNNFLDIGTKNFLDRDIKRIILQSEGVIKITEYQSILNKEDRNLTIESKIVTIFGVAIIGGISV